MAFKNWGHVLLGRSDIGRVCKFAKSKEGGGVGEGLSVKTVITVRVFSASLCVECQWYDPCLCGGGVKRRVASTEVPYVAGRVRVCQESGHTHSTHPAPGRIVSD